MFRPIATLLALALAGVMQATAQSPTAAPTSLTFTYQVNSLTLPPSQTLAISVPTSLANSVLTVTTQPLGSWLTVTPDTGRAPLSLTVNVNPTSLTPGSYSGSITVSAGGSASSQVTVPVILAISNPPAKINVTSPSANYTPTSTPPVFSFSYVTGDPAPTPAAAQLNVASSGDTIPFTATTGTAGSGTASATQWLRVAVQGQLASTRTSGVALSGSFVPLTVTLDQVALSSLNPGSYAASITIAGNNTANGSFTVNVNLVVSAGAPTVTGMFPQAVVVVPAASVSTTASPVITISGDNFFSTSVVTITAQGAVPPGIPIAAQTLPSTLLSRKVLRATIPPVLLTAPLTWAVSVTNPAPPNYPSQQPAAAPNFVVMPATTPLVSSVANASSYLSTATFTGTAGNDPLSGTAYNTTMASREIISIFGQNLGPATPLVATPATVGPSSIFGNTLGGIQVGFQINGSPIVYAPIIMVSANQVNAIVPAAVVPPGLVTVTVVNNGVSSNALTGVIVAADPGVFTFGGLGKGQAAVLNYDAASNTTVVNSSKDTAAKGSPIELFVTGLGDYDPAFPLADGEVATGAVRVAANTVRVDIDGQPAVVTYAGTSPGAVAGLVQVNAIVPPTVRTGAAIPITVSAGDVTVSRRSQALVTLGVK